jgi:chorismate-pyruvate lyase
MTLLTLPEKTPSAPAWASLMEYFYTKAGLPMVDIETLPADAIPQPYRRLLAHSMDMTSTLESFYGRRLELEPLNREMHGTEYLREIILHLQGRNQAVEYGVIRIFLNRFSRRAKELILEENKPLGAILHSEAIAHLGWPQDFFRVQPDSHLKSVFRLNRSLPLYGRRNLLLDGSRHILADVIEVLAPADPD